MSKVLTTALLAGALSAGSVAALAQGSGPVAQQCRAEIAKHCAGKSHEGREVRTCLESKKSELSDACKKALDTTGGGQGKAPRKS